MSMYDACSVPLRHALYDEVKARWCAHPTTTETFISVVAGLDCEDTPTVVRALVDDTSVFNINLAGVFVPNSAALVSV